MRATAAHTDVRPRHGRCCESQVLEEVTMSDTATTNLILFVIAGATLMQSLLLISIALWARARLAELRAHADGLDVPRLVGRAHAALDDLHAISQTASRAGLAVERTANGVHAVMDVAGHEVRRATMGVRTAFDVITAVARRATAARAGLRAGVSELLRSSRPRETRTMDEAITVSEGGHD